jgi:pteridine reductase
MFGMDSGLRRGGKAVLITGGAKRVGAAVALYFARQGYDIALHYNLSKADALKLQKQIEKQGRMCKLFSLDLQRTKDIPMLMAQVKKAMPHCTVLINNASIFERMEFLKTDEALFDRQFTVNFKAPFFLTQTFAKTFKKGSVVNILDTDVVTTQGSHFAYLLSKKMLAEFTLMAALDIAPDIRVNGIAPCIVLPSGEWDNAYITEKKKRLPLQHIPELSDVAQAAHFLCENSVITGQVLFIDSGQHLL